MELKDLQIQTCAGPNDPRILESSSLADVVVDNIHWKINSTPLSTVPGQTLDIVQACV